MALHELFFNGRKRVEMGKIIAKTFMTSSSIHLTNHRWTSSGEASLSGFLSVNRDCESTVGRYHKTKPCSGQTQGGHCTRVEIADDNKQVEEQICNLLLLCAEVKAVTLEAQIHASEIWGPWAKSKHETPWIQTLTLLSPHGYKGLLTSRCRSHMTGKRLALMWSHWRYLQHRCGRSSDEKKAAQSSLLITFI